MNDIATCKSWMLMPSHAVCFKRASRAQKKKKNTGLMGAFCARYPQERELGTYLSAFIEYATCTSIAWRFFMREHN
jgi:hypothetical protein